MNRWQPTDGQRGRRVSGRVLAVLLAGSLAAGALAQVPVQQDGRLFDRNPMVGSGGYNYYARPMSPLIAGNAIASGTVRGGLALRSVSPISSPTAFRAPLGSSFLGGFLRDSVSGADVGSPYLNPLGTPYYDPSTTVATAGFLSGQYGRTTPQVGVLAPGYGQSALPAGAPGPLDLRLNVGTSPGLGVLRGGASSLAAQIVGLSPGTSPELSSTIFGPPAPRAWSPPLVGQDLVSGLIQPVRPEQRRLGDVVPYAQLAPEEPPGSRAPLGTPLELVRRGVTQRIPTPEYVDPFAPASEESAALVPGILGVEPAGEPAGETVVAPRATRQPSATLAPIRDVSILPGYDVFTDMQLARSLEADPGASWWEQMQAAIRENPAAAESLDEQATMESQEFINKVRAAPITTFRGQGASALNNELLKAESLLEIGRFYEAVNRYDAAHRLAPLNPLPLVGKGNALLAAGEYLSAVVALLQGFERYPELTEFDFDLQTLMGGGEVVDMRRADLMRRLRSQEDPQLRFLLGYLEYYGGNRESGLENLEKAAATDLSGSIISRFPEMLRGGASLPPPKLPPTDSPAPPDSLQRKIRGRDDSRPALRFKRIRPPEGDKP